MCVKLWAVYRKIYNICTLSELWNEFCELFTKWLWTKYSVHYHEDTVNCVLWNLHYCVLQTLNCVPRNIYRSIYLLLCTVKCEHVHQEIYRPGTAISHASNLCTAVEGDQNKEFRGNASFLREKGPRGGIQIYIAIVFSILTRKPNIISIRSNWCINLFFIGL